MIQAVHPISPELERVARTIVERFDPERVVLFGSRARGDAHADSDYDIMVVLETALPDSERIRAVREAIRDHALWAELFVCTPSEFERKRFDVGTLVYAAEHEGRVLYTRPGSALGAAPSRVREKPTAPPESYAEWMARVESDYRTMEILLREPDPPLDPVCFHAHAGVEKLLKSVLVSQHTPPPRTHNLTDILALCPDAVRADEHVQHACTLLEAVWPRSRYPNGAMPTPRDAAQAAAAARAVRAAIKP